MLVYEYTRYCYSSGNTIERTELTLIPEDGKGDILATKGRCSWSNRPWQRFSYETSRMSAAYGLPAGLKEAAMDVLVYDKRKEVEDEAKSFEEAFKAAWDALTDTSKEMVRKNVGHINDEDEANAALSLIMMTALTQDAE